MLVTLSPSKGQDFEEPCLSKKHSKPADLKDSESLIKELRKLKSKKLQEMMAVSENIANLNVDRYKSFNTPFTTKNAKQAIFAFKGDVYGGLDLISFNEDDYAYAQDHLRILSGLYGCLRPMDLIQPYRLEMKTKLKNDRGENLYQFWDDRITKSLNKELKKQEEAVLVNLASNEYFKSVKKKEFAGQIITPVFKDQKNGQYKIISFYAKKARGLMARYIIERKLTELSQLQAFAVDGYYFVESESTETELTFYRDEKK